VKKIGALGVQMPVTRDMREKGPEQYEYRDWMKNKLKAEEKRFGAAMVTADGTTWIRMRGKDEIWQYVVAGCGFRPANGVYVPRMLPGYDGPMPYQKQNDDPDSPASTLWIIRWGLDMWYIADIGPKGMWRGIGKGAREFYFSQYPEDVPPVGECWLTGEGSHGVNPPPIVLRSKMGKTTKGAMGFKNPMLGGKTKTPGEKRGPHKFTDKPLHPRLGDKNETPGGGGYKSRTYAASKGGGLHYEPGSSTSSAESTPRKPWKGGINDRHKQKLKDLEEADSDDDEDDDIKFQKQLAKAMAESQKTGGLVSVPTPDGPSEEEQLRAALKASILETQGEQAAKDYEKASEEEQLEEALKRSASGDGDAVPSDVEEALRRSVSDSAPPDEEAELEAALRASMGDTGEPAYDPLTGYTEARSGQMGTFGTPSTARSEGSSGSFLMPPGSGGMLSHRSEVSDLSESSAGSGCPPSRGVAQGVNGENVEDDDLAKAIRESLAMGEGDVSDADLQAALRASVYEEPAADDPIWRTPRSEAGEEDEGMVCPMTGQPISEAVSCSDGNIYERAAIEEWLEYHDVSPVTGEQLANKTLMPLGL